MNQKSQKRLIAGLPSGVSAAKHTVGGNRTMFRVVLGKRFTGGKTVEKHFGRLESAREWLNEQIGHRAQLQAVSLTPAQLSEAKNAFDRLKEAGMSLTEAVSFAVRHGPRKSRRRFEELTAEFIRSRENMGCKGKTMTNYRSKFHVMSEEFNGAMVDAITTRRIEDWLDEQEEWSSRTRYNYITDLRALLEYAVTSDYCTQNAAMKVAKPILKHDRPGILSPVQAQALLCTAVEHDPEMMPGVAIQLFAGVRRSEVCALNWEQVGEEYIEIPATIAKGRRRRLIDISDALKTWLDKTTHPRIDLTPSKSPDVYGERLSDLAVKAGITPWPHNALRHSFGSYHLARDKHEGSTAMQMGNTPDIVIKHYREVVRRHEAEAFWKIQPPEPEPNIVAFQASAA